MDVVNKVLVVLEKEGEIDVMWIKWFGFKIKFNIFCDKKFMFILVFCYVG